MFNPLIILALLFFMIVLPALNEREKGKDFKKALKKWSCIVLGVAFFLFALRMGLFPVIYALLAGLFLWGTRLLKLGILYKAFADNFQYVRQLFSEEEIYQEKKAFEDSMSREEACKILEVSENASKEDIKKAYKKIISKNHPDSGGSTYLASKVNQAKDVLLK